MRVSIHRMTGRVLAAALVVVVCCTITDAFAQTSLLQSDGRVVLEADGVIEWNREELYYAAEGNVRLTRDTWSLRADRVQAHYDAEGEDGQALSRDLNFAQAFGRPVLAESEDGTQIVAPEIRWWPQEARLQTFGEGATLDRGDGGRLTARESLMWWESLGGRPVAEARGEVVATSPDGETIHADHIRALFSPSTGEIQEYQAVGSVIVERKNGEIAKSRQARYDVGEQRIVLEGEVRLEREGQVLQGERAEMDLSSGRSSLLPAEGGRVQGQFETTGE
ncbi:MAG: hypothetical protein OD811_02130 [Alphaproteobacteria bacterium]